MQLTKAQKEALKEVKTNVLLGENTRGRGHVYDMRNKNKLVDARTVNALQKKDLIEWGYDWGYNDNILELTEKGEEIYEEKELG